MVTRSWCWLALVWVLSEGFSEPATAAGSQETLHDGRTDPYTLKLQSPEQYKLTTPEADTGPPSLIRTTPVPEFGGHPFQKEIAKVATEFKVDPALVHAVIQVESGYNASARSPKGAQGLMQLLPETAKRFGIATADLLWKPERNIRAGVAYLRSLLELFEQDISLALAAYNAGENAVLRYGRQIPPFPETRDYVPKVLAIYNQLRPPLEPETATAPTARVRIRYPPPLTEAQPDGPLR